jgi:uncharacterized repeat protein (TIGR01451 family)
MIHLRKTVRFLVPLTLVLAIHASALAQAPGGKFGPASATPLEPDSQYSIQAAKETAPGAGVAARGAVIREPMVSVIVKLSDESLAGYTGGISGLPATSPEATGAAQLDVNAPASQLYLAYLAQQGDTFVLNASSKVPAAQITHRFDVVIGGVAMLVPASQINLIATLPGVKAVYPDQILQLDTDRTPQFIGADEAWTKLNGQQFAGDGVVVGVLDTGIWPEHPSFSDPDPKGRPYGPRPATWKGTTCQFGSATPGDVPFACNNKLIGAQRFMSTYDAVIGLTPGEFVSARDDDGHGTHTASTAAGNGRVAASIFGIPRGIISGVAPRAQVAAYKVCGLEGCFGSDSADAVQQAIRDGVNVINFSISGGSNPYADAVELAFLDAYAAGVFVAASAGNAGPGLDTTDHRGPWVTTVAASTADRAFKTTATLVAGSNTFAVNGTSLTGGVSAPAPVVYAGNAPYNDPTCNTATADGAFAGKIVVCIRGGTPGRVQKGYNVLQRGAVGMILFNQAANVTDLETDNHFLPAVHIQFGEGQNLLAFLTANPGATASWPAGAKTTQQGDVMASFSSRGGPGQSIGISKPDITAPGVQILAGHTPRSADIATGPTGELFQAIAGTSMSSPHIAGSGALLKALHPNWTPGQIKSALMTTAETKVVKEDGITPANAFDFGSGRVDLNVAWNAALSFDETKANYLALKDQLWNANYPSLYVPAMPGAITVQRTVHNETNKNTTWKLSVDAPPDVTVIVPKQLAVPANGNATFSITVLAPSVPLGQARFATLWLTKGTTQVHFPITFVRQQPVVTLNKTCDPATLAKGATTTCTITATNMTFANANVVIGDVLPKQLSLIAGSVTGATPSGNSLSFSGSLAAAQPPDVMVASDPGGSPAGYLPLSAFGVAPVAGVTDDSITNFNVPAFVYGSQTYSRIGFVSNGYAIVGGGSGPDLQFLGTSFPNAARPNNVLAPFWTDFNPPAGGALRIGTLTDGVNTWLVLDWEAVKEYSAARVDSFQIWIRTGTVEDITFTYGTLQGNGDGGLLSVGAENLFGNRGSTYYFNGTGTLPTSATELRVSTTPPQPGGSQVITFRATADKKGAWENCATLSSDLFQGINYACASGTVNP